MFTRYQPRCMKAIDEYSTIACDMAATRPAAGFFGVGSSSGPGELREKASAQTKHNKPQSAQSSLTRFRRPSPQGALQRAASVVELPLCLLLQRLMTTRQVPLMTRAETTRWRLHRQQRPTRVAQQLLSPWSPPVPLPPPPPGLGATAPTDEPARAVAGGRGRHHRSRGRRGSITPRRVARVQAGQRVNVEVVVV